MLANISHINLGNLDTLNMTLLFRAFTRHKNLDTERAFKLPSHRCWWVAILQDDRLQISAVAYVKSIKNITPYEVKGDGEIVNVDRTKVLTELLAKHNNGEIRYMRQQNIRDEIFDHLKTTKKIRDRSSDGDIVERFVKTSDTDHWVHSLNYTHIAGMLVETRSVTGVIGMMPGVSSVQVGGAMTKGE